MSKVAAPSKLTAAASGPLVVALLVLATPLRAADVAPREAAPRWTGPWAGVIGAAGRIGGDGALVGVAGGYALQFDQYVFGVDGDLSGGGLDARRLGGRFEIEALGSIRARIGYAFDRFVLFGAAGVAFASSDYARGGESDRKLQFGWTAGLGVDMALTERLSARAEYIYVDLDRRSFDASGATWYGPSGGAARLGLNYRF